MKKILIFALIFAVTIVCAVNAFAQTKDKKDSKSNVKPAAPTITIKADATPLELAQIEVD